MSSAAERRRGRALVECAGELSRAVAGLRFGAPVTHVYNPLEYARGPHEAYLEQWASRGAPTLLLGMNPGPYGMAQTGVPFGEISVVRDWLGLERRVGKPRDEHPRRPVQGFGCKRSEVSGRRLWGWARESFGSPERFFSHYVVMNYCPLVFMEEGGRNRTPDKLPRAEQQGLYELCDRALERSVEILGVETVLGVGRFAETRARVALDDEALAIDSVPHPSPANPRANAGWQPLIEEVLARRNLALQA